MADNAQKVEDVGELTVEKAIARKRKQHPVPRSSPQHRRGKKAAGGPTVTQRILQVTAATKERRGISLAALKKALSAKGYDVNRNNTRVNQTVKHLVRNGSLVQTAGVGASGSFRFNRSRNRADTPALGIGGGGGLGGSTAAANFSSAVAAAASFKDDGGAPKKKPSGAPKATPTSSKKLAQAKSSATAAKKGRGGAVAARRKGGAAKPKKTTPAPRRKLKSVRGSGGRGGKARPYRKNKPLRGGRKTAAGAIRRRRPLASKTKKLGRPRKYPPFRSQERNPSVGAAAAVRHKELPQKLVWAICDFHVQYFPN
ncbi:uncharacterized protein LOC144497608 [Mustelus asterias]